MADINEAVMNFQANSHNLVLCNVLPAVMTGIFWGRVNCFVVNLSAAHRQLSTEKKAAFMIVSRGSNVLPLHRDESINWKNFWIGWLCYASTTILSISFLVCQEQKFSLYYFLSIIKSQDMRHNYAKTNGYKQKIKSCKKWFQLVGICWSFYSINYEK